MCMCDCLPFLSKPTFWEKILLVATCSGYYAIPKVKNKHITKQNSAATPQVILTATDSKSEKQLALKLYLQFAHPGKGISGQTT